MLTPLPLAPEVHSYAGTMQSTTQYFSRPCFPDDVVYEYVLIPTAKEPSPMEPSNNPSQHVDLGRKLEHIFEG